jgi:hypothetical protein
MNEQQVCRNCVVVYSLEKKCVSNDAKKLFSADMGRLLFWPMAANPLQTPIPSTQYFCLDTETVAAENKLVDKGGPEYTHILPASG